MKESADSKVLNKPNVLNSFSTAVMALFTIVFMTNSAMAHPGHDHNANESMLMHVLFYGSIVIALAACIWVAYRQFTKQKDKWK